MTKQQKEAIWQRDKYTCQKCGKVSTSGELDVHHKKPKARGGTNAPDNLVTWCRKCHRMWHIKYGIDY